MSINRSDLIQHAAKNTDVTKEQAAAVIQQVENKISEALKQGENVLLTGFGTFKLTDTKERQGHNPKTGEKMTIAAGKRISFSPADALKESVAGQ